MSVLTQKRDSINREFQTQPYRSFDNYQKQIDTNRTLENVLDPGVSGKMFSSQQAKISLEEWRHPSDLNSMDGQKIFSNSITADQIKANTITATELNVSSLDAITATIGDLEAGTVSDDAGTAANRKIVLDLDNKWLKVYDDQGTPQLRVQIGSLA